MEARRLQVLQGGLGPGPEAEAPVTPEPDTAALVLAAQGGSRAAFAELYARYGRLVHGILLAQVPPAEASDLVQDVFLRALEKLVHLREPAAFGPWLSTIARNTAKNRHRRQRPMEAGLAVLAAPQPAEVEAHAILALIGELPLAYRETLILRLVEDMSGPDIAARLGLKAASVRVNLHRGMKLLRERLSARKEDCRE